MVSNKFRHFWLNGFQVEEFFYIFIHLRLSSPPLYSPTLSPRRLWFEQTWDYTTWRCFQTTNRLGFYTIFNEFYPFFFYSGSIFLLGIFIWKKNPRALIYTTWRCFHTAYFGKWFLEEYFKRLFYLFMSTLTPHFGPSPTHSKNDLNKFESKLSANVSTKVSAFWPNWIWEEICWKILTNVQQM